MFISWICKSKFEKRLKRRGEGKKTKKLEQILRKFEIKQHISSLKITRDSTRVLQKQNVHAHRHEAMPMCVEGLRVHGLLKHFQLLICKPYP